MEELQNLRSDSELLESKVVAPILITIIKLVTKAVIGSLGFISYYYGRSCGSQMDDLILGSCVSLGIESGLLLFFIILILQAEKCEKFASYCMIYRMIIDVLIDIFYIGWLIYVTINYFNENDCNQDMTITDIIGLTIVIYYMVALSLMICCCGAKLCTCFSALVATAKTDVDRSLSHDLLTVRQESGE